MQRCVAKVCLATSARWSEAESLETRHLRNDQIQFAGTKSGKAQTIPIEPQLAQQLQSHHLKAETGQRLFAPCDSAFREAVERSGIQLQDGQLIHVLRHTFASHFMMNGGNILVLQRSLGHTNRP